MRSRRQIADLIERRWFRAGVLVLIIANALILGTETFSGVNERAGLALLVMDRLIVYAFVAGISLRMFAEAGSYFKKGWTSSIFWWCWCR